MPVSIAITLTIQGRSNTVNTSHPRVLQMVMDSLRLLGGSQCMSRRLSFLIWAPVILGREPEL